MSEAGAASTTSNQPAAPAGAQPEGTPVKFLRGSKLEQFLYDNQAPAPGEAEPQAAAARGARKPAPAADEPLNASRAGLEGADLEGEAAEDSEFAELGADQGEAVEAKPVLPEDKGEKDAPYGVNDLPEDRFIEIKVDGQKEVVSLRELARGHIRQKAFDRFTSQARAAQDQAQQVAQQAVQWQETSRQALDSFLTDPKRFFTFVVEHHPEAGKFLEPFGRLTADLLIRWRDNPQERLEHDHQRRTRALQQREQHIEQTRQNHERTAAQRAAQQAEISTLTPAWEEGMKEIGFPRAGTLPPKFQATLELLIASARRANGGALHPDDLKEAIHQAHQMHPGASSVQARKPVAAPIAPPKPAALQRKPSKDWSQVPYNKRVNDPQFYLDNMKRR